MQRKRPRRQQASTSEALGWPSERVKSSGGRLRRQCYAQARSHDDPRGTKEMEPWPLHCVGGGKGTETTRGAETNRAAVIPKLRPRDGITNGPFRVNPFPVLQLPGGYQPQKRRRADWSFKMPVPSPTLLLLSFRIILDSPKGPG
ncbi:hypothetical protein MRX96_029446 [Rhipicephalus microplus]